ncbi:uncharacterized protein LOC128268686 [Anopheles cruzii]|uniref:uncharacterized protein LOC128268686 n=1 Tax=Anopheles cruzii TaxID=68878 RepID=UPI0022EC3887|nr:uncharacterized protein LOC128268686 [Anopheles cruzii]
MNSRQHSKMLRFLFSCYGLLFVIVVWKYAEREDTPSSGPLESICEYDVKQLCPECFTDTSVCRGIGDIFKPQDGSWSSRINSLFAAHSTTLGTLGKTNTLAVMKRLNRRETIEQLSREFCATDANTYSVSATHRCAWSRSGTLKAASAFVTDSILDKRRVEGCIFCPPNTKHLSLQRFLSMIEPTATELWKLLVVRANAEPLILKLLSQQQRSFPVPTLLHSFGFSIIESFDGEPLNNFYDHQPSVRMMIARELIKAAFRFTEGAAGFRFYLTDLSPDNVAIKLTEDSKTVSVSLVDLDNIIVLDSLADGFSSNRHHVHGKIECDGCFAYVQDDVCGHRSSDLNYFAVCQLLHENLNGNAEVGLLHLADEVTDAAQILHELLDECVHCQPPSCRNRSIILEEMLNVLDQCLA